MNKEFVKDTHGVFQKFSDRLKRGNFKVKVSKIWTCIFPEILRATWRKPLPYNAR